MERTLKRFAELKDRIEQQEETIEQLGNENRLLRREVNLAEEKLNNAYKRIRDLIPILP
jgi:uncharacterized coiled-coil protein SlyX